MGTRKIQLWDMVGAYPVCPSCGSKQVVRDAWATWSMAHQQWQLKSVFDTFACDNCSDQAVPDWAIDEEFRRQRICRLNDLLRHGQYEHGTMVVTGGIHAEGEDFVRKSLTGMMSFDAFGADNDPHGEHDFGAFEVEGQKLFFKIDYFDLEMERHSDDAANPSCTHRVLTIMLANEY